MEPAEVTASRVPNDSWVESVNLRMRVLDRCPKILNMAVSYSLERRCNKYQPAKRSFTSVAVSLLVFGFATFAVLAPAWPLAPPATIRDLNMMASASCNMSSSVRARNETSTDGARKVDHEDRPSVPQLELRLRRDLSLRSGRLAPSVMVACAAGMNFPPTRNEKVPGWASQVRSERIEKVRT